MNLNYFLLCLPNSLYSNAASKILSAMGTILLHLLQLTRTLPLPQDKICHTVTTGTVEVLPENDDDDMKNYSSYYDKRSEKKFFGGEEPEQEYMGML